MQGSYHYVRLDGKPPSRTGLFFKLLGYDIRFGFGSNKVLFLISFMVFLVLALMFSSAASMPSIGDGEGGFIDLTDEYASAVDYLLSFYKGIEVFNPAGSKTFDLPVFWLGIQVCVALLVSLYPSRDLYSYAPQVFVRTRNKWIWWLAKCFWIIITVLAFYTIGIIIALVAALIGGGSALEVNVLLNAFFNKLDVFGLEPLDFVFLLLLPAVVSIALSLVQMALSFIVKPVWSFIVIMSYHLVSWVVFSPFLISDYGMLARNGLFIRNGLASEFMLLVCCAVIVFVVIVGIPLFRRMNLYQK